MINIHTYANYHSDMICGFRIFWVYIQEWYITSHSNSYDFLFVLGISMLCCPAWLGAGNITGVLRNEEMSETKEMTYIHTEKLVSDGLCLL